MTLGNTFKTPQGSLDMSTGLMVDGANPNGVDPKRMTWGVAGLGPLQNQVGPGPDQISGDGEMTSPEIGRLIQKGQGPAIGHRALGRQPGKMMDGLAVIGGGLHPAFKVDKNEVLVYVQVIGRRLGGLRPWVYLRDLEKVLKFTMVIFCAVRRAAGVNMTSMTACHPCHRQRNQLVSGIDPQDWYLRGNHRWREVLVVQLGVL